MVDFCIKVPIKKFYFKFTNTRNYDTKTFNIKLQNTCKLHRFFYYSKGMRDILYCNLDIAFSAVSSDEK